MDPNLSAASVGNDLLRASLGLGLSVVVTAGAFGLWRLDVPPSAGIRHYMSSIASQGNLLLFSWTNGVRGVFFQHIIT